MIKIGIIGGGRIARVHIKALSVLKNIELVAIADPVAKDLEDLAKAMNISHAYKDHKKILEDKSIQAVLICSPSDTHYQISLEAIAAGKHVFCEKPVDLKIDRVKEIQKKVDESKLVYMVGFNRRFDKEFIALKNAIIDGKIGNVELIQLTSRDPQPPAVEYIKLSGGLFKDMMIHDFDMALHLANEPVTSVYAVGSALVDKAIATEGNDIDTAIVTLEFKSGAKGVITNSRRATYGYDQRAEVHGSKACIMNGNQLVNNNVLMSKGVIQTEPLLDFFLERYMDAYTREMIVFVEAIEQGKLAPISATDALQSLILAEAAYTSLKEKRVVYTSEFN